MAANYSAVVQQSGEWWIGWVEEVPGVNSQGETRAELLDNLRDALEEMLEMIRAEARAAASGPIRKPREGWAAAFEDMARRGDDSLLDNETPRLSTWDEDEWEW